MTKARDLANASTALSAVSATELAFVDGVTSAIQTQLDAKAATASTVSTAGGSTVTVASGTTVPLTIQNNGTGNSFVVNDVASDATPFVIDAAGNVGIGTSSPAGPLDVQGSNSFLNGLRLNGGNTADTIYQASTDIGISIGNASNIKFNTNNSERMRITGDGKIQIPASVVFEAPLVTNAQTASYTVVLSDAAKLVEMNVGAGNIIVIPLNADVAFPIGTQINILQTGAGQTTITPNAGVTLNSTPGAKLRAQWSSATIIKRATNTWVAVGDLSA